MLLGATGTGKTATIAWVAEQVQRPILVMQPNKTLAAQFANELRELLPAQRGRVLRLLLRLLPARGLRPADRHLHREGLLDQRGGRAAAALGDQLAADPARRDRGRDGLVHLRPRHPAGVRRPDAPAARSATSIDRDALLRRLVEIQYTRNDLAFTRGTFRVRGDTLEIFPVYEEHAVRDRVLRRRDRAADDAAPGDRRGDHRGRGALRLPGHPLRRRARSGWSGRSAASRPSSRSGSPTFERQGKLLEAQRLRMRTTYDIEMMRQVGSCSGIENYSMHIDGRGRGSRAELPARLLPRGLPARHRRVPRRRAADRRRCTRATCPASATWSTTASGCRSAMDNRPLRWEEFLERIGQTIYLSATPGNYELDKVAGRRRRADHPARPAWSTPRSWSSRPRARSTT